MISKYGFDIKEGLTKAAIQNRPTSAAKGKKA